MGKIMTNLKITNNTDYDNATEGLIAASQVRSVEVEALVDTGATMLALPEDVVAAVGVPYAGYRKVRDARGIVVSVPWVGGLRIEERLALVGDGALPARGRRGTGRVGEDRVIV